MKTTHTHTQIYTLIKDDGQTSHAMHVPCACHVPHFFLLKYAVFFEDMKRACDMRVDVACVWTWYACGRNMCDTSVDVACAWMRYIYILCIYNYIYIW